MTAAVLGADVILTDLVSADRRFPFVKSLFARSHLSPLIVQPEVLPSLNLNLALNYEVIGGRAQTHPLDWLAAGLHPDESQADIARSEMPDRWSSLGSRHDCMTVRRPLKRIWNAPVLRYDVIMGADVVWVEWLIEPLMYTLSCIADPDTAILIAYQSRSKRAGSFAFTCASHCLLFPNTASLFFPLADEKLHHWAKVYQFKVETLERGVFNSAVDILRLTLPPAPEEDQTHFSRKYFD